MPREALGLIEIRDMIGAIEVTRAATKAAELVIISAEQNGSGRVTVKIEGSWSAVLSAVEAGARAAEKAGQLVSMHLIGNPDDNLSTILPYQSFIDRYQPSDSARPKAVPVRSNPPKISRPAPSKPAKKPAPPKAAPAKPVAKPAAPKPASPKPPVAAAPVSAAPVEMPSMAELEEMSVVKLRKFARTVTNLPIQGRQISMANKTQLLEAIRALTKE